MLRAKRIKAGNNAIKMSITLNAYLKKEVDSVCEELGKSKSGIIAEALEYYFDYLDLAIAEERLKNRTDKALTFEEMEQFIDELEA